MSTQISKNLVGASCHNSSNTLLSVSLCFLHKYDEVNKAAETRAENANTPSASNCNAEKLMEPPRVEVTIALQNSQCTTN